MATKANDPTTGVGHDPHQSRGAAPPGESQTRAMHSNVTARYGLPTGQRFRRRVVGRYSPRIALGFVLHAITAWLAVVRCPNTVVPTLMRQRG